MDTAELMMGFLMILEKFWDKLFDLQLYKAN